MKVRSDDDGKINGTTRVYRTWKYEPKLYEQLELRKVQHKDDRIEIPNKAGGSR